MRYIAYMVIAEMDVASPGARAPMNRTGRVMDITVVVLLREARASTDPTIVIGTETPLPIGLGTATGQSTAGYMAYTEGQCAGPTLHAARF